jgi:hypothetical protein
MCYLYVLHLYRPFRNKAIMKKAKTIQANYRLPESLLSDLKEVSEAAEIPQTQLVREGIEARVRRAKRVIERRQNAELAPA